MHLQMRIVICSLIVCQYITGCRPIHVHLTYLPNGQQDGKAYVEFCSDYDQQRALDRNDCNVGIEDISGN
jgi:hypothetical protein